VSAVRPAYPAGPPRRAIHLLLPELPGALMSYRAFKHLLGETSLERKCRFLFGAGILLLLTAAFWWYASRTENVAYLEATKTCRVLATEAFEAEHLKRRLGAKKWQELEELSKQNMPKALPSYWSDIIIPKIPHHLDPKEVDLIKEFQNDPEKNEDSWIPPAKTGEESRSIHYYGAIRASKQGLAGLSPTPEELKAYGDVKENDLLAVVKVILPTKSIEEEINVNRALLISTALVTAVVIMIGSYLIIRYVIVKPVKHLKEVSDAISAGQLNVRSEIQTGDEFEDLSHAFNRMLRSLVSMQDRLKKANTDLDRKVDELAQANMALYESNRLKSDFLATMSHELRTPLNNILGFSEVLLASDSLNEKQQRWIRNVQSSGDRLLNLINDILDLAKIEAGKMKLRLEEFRIQDVCDGMVNTFRPLAEKKNIDLRSLVEPDIPLLKQDQAKLQQILSNLLSNALKFTPEGGRVLLKTEADAHHLALTVTDTGVGIAAEEQELVFEKFRQSGNPLTREHAGTGLGLSIVRELCKLLGGEITLESELGRGSIFQVRLPLQLGEESRLEFDLMGERIDLSRTVGPRGANGPETDESATVNGGPARTNLPVSSGDGLADSGLGI
jgi:two-component system, NarL family, sensor histidine kinase BarA